MNISENQKANLYDAFLTADFLISLPHLQKNNLSQTQQTPNYRLFLPRLKAILWSTLYLVYNGAMKEKGRL